VEGRQPSFFLAARKSTRFFFFSQAPGFLPEHGKNPPFFPPRTGFGESAPPQKPGSQSRENKKGAPRRGPNKEIFLFLKKKNPSPAPLKMEKNLFLFSQQQTNGKGGGGGGRGGKGKRKEEIQSINIFFVCCGRGPFWFPKKISFFAPPRRAKKKPFPHPDPPFSDFLRKAKSQKTVPPPPWAKSSGGIPPPPPMVRPQKQKSPMRWVGEKTGIFFFYPPPPPPKERFVFFSSARPVSRNGSTNENKIKARAPYNTGRPTSHKQNRAPVTNFPAAQAVHPPPHPVAPKKKKSFGKFFAWNSPFVLRKSNPWGNP